MRFDSSRLRSGEWIAGVGAVVLLASMFLLKWYGLNATLAPTARQLGLATSVDVWNALSTIRWLLLVTVASALTLVYFQATRPAPALPVTFSAIATILGLLSTLALIYRVLINPPGSGNQITTRGGAYVGLLGGLILTWGAMRSLRQEGIAARDAPANTPTENPSGAG